MDNALSGFVILLALVVMASLSALFATSTGVLYYQEQAQDQHTHYTCYYVTTTGPFTRSIASSSGCRFFAAVVE